MNKNKIEFGDGVKWNGDDYMVIGFDEDRKHIQIVPYPEGAYDVPFKELEFDA